MLEPRKAIKLLRSEHDSRLPITKIRKQALVGALFSQKSSAARLLETHTSTLPHRAGLILYL